ncbi:hypothetical protein PUW24_00380 (plasmid) [Paenibacillus urinalis]|nr:hypothetical protein [Paenibacillus urinalis]WDH95257.1 hypothetical protein PUW24_00380 [Paenibacillus urinalis]
MKRAQNLGFMLEEIKVLLKRKGKYRIRSIKISLESLTT